MRRTVRRNFQLRLQGELARAKVARVTLDLARIADTLSGVETVQTVGRLREVVGLSIRADVPGIRLGELCEIERRVGEPLLAEVVGFRDQSAMLMPLSRPDGLGPDDAVRPADRPLQVRVGDDLLGRVLDGLGRPIDGGAAITGTPRDVDGKPPAPLSRPRIDTTLSTGLRVLDAFTTLGFGQRIGLFAGSGVGKSSLLGQIARHAAADVYVVCLVGERGRELGELLEDALDQGARERGVVICATSDEPPLLRVKSAHVATTIAEHFRDQGKRVLLLMDSMTRFARAARDVALASGEAPARRGYPPSVWSALPALVERAGTAATGSITAVYSVLVEGDDFDEPIADELRGLLDGHIVLSRTLAGRGHFPAVDVTKSLSRAMPRLCSPAHLKAAAQVRADIALYEEKRDLITLGAYRQGSDPKLDSALARMEAITSFLCQPSNAPDAFEHTVQALQALL